MESDDVIYMVTVDDIDDYYSAEINTSDSNAIPEDIAISGHNDVSGANSISESNEISESNDIPQGNNVCEDGVISEGSDTFEDNMYADNDLYDDNSENDVQNMSFGSDEADDEYEEWTKTSLEEAQIKLLGCEELYKHADKALTMVQLLDPFHMRVYWKLYKWRVKWFHRNVGDYEKSHWFTYGTELNYSVDTIPYNVTENWHRGIVARLDQIRQNFFLEHEEHQSTLARTYFDEQYTKEYLTDLVECHLEDLYKEELLNQLVLLFPKEPLKLKVLASMWTKPFKGPNLDRICAEFTTDLLENPENYISTYGLVIYEVAKELLKPDYSSDEEQPL